MVKLLRKNVFCFENLEIALRKLSYYTWLLLLYLRLFMGDSNAQRKERQNLH